MKKIKLAYIISAYKLPVNLGLLVDELCRSDTTSYIVICVDRHTSLPIYKEMKKLEKKYNNVKFLPRKNSVYRSFGHVRSTLRGIEYLNINKVDYDFVFLMTGQDYPIKSSEQIETFLNKYRGRSFMEYFTLPSNNWQHGGLDRIDRYHIHTRRGRFSIARKNIPFLRLKNIPNNLKPFGGSGYWTLCKKHTDYIMKYLKENPYYVEFFKKTDIPDELFFQTVLINSPYAKDIINDDLRYIDWSKPGEYPAIIRSKDYEKLKSNNALFARKFDVSVDSKIITNIKKGLL